MNTKWEGLWAQERQGFYSGYMIKKSDIPAHTRLVVRYNKYYEKDSTKPRFIYCFADAEGYAKKCIPLEVEEDQPYWDEECNCYFTGDNERLYTEAEVQNIVNRCACYVGGDAEYGEHLVSDFI